MCFVNALLLVRLSASRNFRTKASRFGGVSSGSTQDHVAARTVARVSMADRIDGPPTVNHKLVLEHKMLRMAMDVSQHVNIHNAYKHRPQGTEGIYSLSFAEASNLYL